MEENRILGKIEDIVYDGMEDIVYKCAEELSKNGYALDVHYGDIRRRLMSIEDEYRNAIRTISQNYIKAVKYEDLQSTVNKELDDALAGVYEKLLKKYELDFGDLWVDFPWDGQASGATEDLAQAMTEIFASTLSWKDRLVTRKENRND